MYVCVYKDIKDLPLLLLKALFFAPPGILFKYELVSLTSHSFTMSCHRALKSHLFPVNRFGSYPELNDAVSGKDFKVSEETIHLRV